METIAQSGQGPPSPLNGPRNLTSLYSVQRSSRPDRAIAQAGLQLDWPHPA
ncbi:hypothetical protein DPMN_166362 [Dreissena polymorpha]|uniref:Uncharacterized protein n=1 Tax=Dreissena polymorpha TaxID=45954 RepID=A0A9D4IXI7_DREPO|nr:hypothetical protein DPMN_166362 [Dreissena polymorpha]